MPWPCTPRGPPRARWARFSGTCWGKPTAPAPSAVSAPKGLAFFCRGGAAQAGSLQEAPAQEALRLRLPGRPLRQGVPRRERSGQRGGLPGPERGLEEALLFITDELAGIEATIKKVYPRAHWQLCAVHKLRSTGRRVKKADEGAILAELKALLRLPGRPEALTAPGCFGRPGQRVVGESHTPSPRGRRAGPRTPRPSCISTITPSPCVR